MKIKKLDMRGFSHDIIVVLFVVFFAIVGVGYLVASHADNNGGWSGWNSIGVGNTIQTPAATSIKGTDTISVFYANQEPPNTGTLFHDVWNGASWSGQTSVDGLIRNPAAVTLGNVTDIFGSGSDSSQQNYRSLMESTNNGGNTWSIWQDIPQGNTSFSAAVTALNSTEYAVYTNGCSGVVMKGQNICQNVWNGSSWSGWQNIGGNALSGPAATTTPSGTTYLFIRGPNNAIYENISVGTSWSGWTSLGGATTSTPAAVSVGGNIDLFIRGTDSSNYENVWNGSSWSGWTSLGGTDLTPPAQGDSTPALPGLGATAYGPNGQNVALFTVGTDGSIYENIYTPPSTSPQPPAAPTNLKASAVSSSQINLSWTASAGASGYAIYGGNNSTTLGSEIATTSTTTYSNTGLSPSTGYHYYVVAYNNVGTKGEQSTPSNTASAVTAVSGEQLSIPPARRPVQYVHVCTIASTLYVTQGSPACLPGGTYHYDYAPTVNGTVYNVPCATNSSAALRYVYISSRESCPSGTFSTSQ